MAAEPGGSQPPCPAPDSRRRVLLLLGRKRLLVTLLKVSCSTLRREVLAGDLVTAGLAAKRLFLVFEEEKMRIRFQSMSFRTHRLRWTPQT